MNKTLLPFYFGSVSNEERLEIERQMLTDTEVLLDYLDLKRNIEGATAVPQTPSPALWQRLRPKVHLSRRSRITLALGFAVAVAASLILIFSNMQKPAVGTFDKSSSTDTKILFDSDYEQFGHSNVL